MVTTTEPETRLRELRRQLLIGAALLATLLLVGTFGYRVISPSTGWIDALYMTTITLTTVGFGEIVDLTGHPGGRLFTIVLILSGMGGVLYFVSTGTAFLLEGQLGHVFWRKRMLAKVQKLRDHLIVCGSGGTAIYTAEELSAVRRPVVLICEDDEWLERVKAELPDIPVIVGDPTSDAVLHQAGVERAAGVVACTRNDKDNLIITLTARQMNPTVRIVSRVSNIHEKEKVQNAGADSVVSPTHIGGLRMASELIRPNVVSFLDAMLRDRGMGRRIDEISFPPDSDFVGRVLADLRLGEVSRALLLACRDREGHWSYNPPPEYTVTPEMTLVVMGTPDEILALSKHLQGRMVSAPLPGKQPT